MRRNESKALILTSALFKRDKTKPIGEIAEDLHLCVDALDFGDEERKAELYARLADVLTPDLLFTHAWMAVEAAMDATDRRFPHG